MDRKKENVCTKLRHSCLFILRQNRVLCYFKTFDVLASFPGHFVLIFKNSRLASTYMGKEIRVPNKIASFKALRKLWLYENKISVIKSGAFSFSVPVSLLNIIDNEITEIESDAFQGKLDNS